MFYAFDFLNIVMYYLINWVFMTATIIMNIRISAIKDSLSLNVELTIVTVLWNLCCFT